MTIDPIIINGKAFTSSINYVTEESIQVSILDTNGKEWLRGEGDKSQQGTSQRMAVRAPSE
jgi:hypothetical protein